MNINTLNSSINVIIIILIVGAVSLITMLIVYCIAMREESLYKKKRNNKELHDDKLENEDILENKYKIMKKSKTNDNKEI